jgi:hypothetical protein
MNFIKFNVGLKVYIIKIIHIFLKKKIKIIWYIIETHQIYQYSTKTHKSSRVLIIYQIIFNFLLTIYIIYTFNLTMNLVKVIFVIILLISYVACIT